MYMYMQVLVEEAKHSVTINEQVLLLGSGKYIELVSCPSFLITANPNTFIMYR